MQVDSCGAMVWTLSGVHGRIRAMPVSVSVSVIVSIHWGCVYTVYSADHRIMSIVVVKVVVVIMLYLGRVVVGACCQDGGDVASRTLKHLDIPFTHVLFVQTGGGVLRMLRGK